MSDTIKIYQPIEYCTPQRETGFQVGDEAIIVRYYGARSGKTMYYVHPLLNEDGQICRDKAVKKYHGFCSYIGSVEVYGEGVHKVTAVNGREIELDKEDLHPEWE